MTVACYNESGDYVGTPSSVSNCVYCGDDWLTARQRVFGGIRDAAPFFKTLVKSGDYPLTRLTQMAWGIKCYSCGKSYLQILLLSPLFKAK